MSMNEFNMRMHFSIEPGTLKLLSMSAPLVSDLVAADLVVYFQLAERSKEHTGCLYWS